MLYEVITPHAELLETCKLYQRLYSMQFLETPEAAANGVKTCRAAKEAALL